MTYQELQDRLSRLTFKAAWDRENFTQEELQEALTLQENQKSYDEYWVEEAKKEWFKRHM